MERGKKKVSMGISWADEVEREEQQETEEKRREINEVGVKANNNRKPNPFGDARPREVVLEEKGINWRKLDQDLECNRSILREVVLEEKGVNRRKLDQEIGHNHSNLREVVLIEKGIKRRKFDRKLEHNHSILRKDKKLKENNKSLASPIVKQNPKHDKSPIVPPLRYAPKNIMSLMEQIRRGRKDFLDVTVENSGIAKNKTSRPRYENQQMHPHGRRQVLGDLNFGSKHCNDGDDYEYRICSANRKRLDIGVRRNPCVDMRNEGEDLRDTIRMKMRLSSEQNDSCNQRRKGSQARK